VCGRAETARRAEVKRGQRAISEERAATWEEKENALHVCSTFACRPARLRLHVCVCVCRLPKAAVCKPRLLAGSFHWHLPAPYAPPLPASRYHGHPRNIVACGSVRASPPYADHSCMLSACAFRASKALGPKIPKHHHQRTARLARQGPLDDTLALKKYCHTAVLHLCITTAYAKPAPTFTVVSHASTAR
jgi:hypothetical protein